MRLEAMRLTGSGQQFSPAIAAKSLAMLGSRRSLNCLDPILILLALAVKLLRLHQETDSKTP
jgi:hypothetical protein